MKQGTQKENLLRGLPNKKVLSENIMKSRNKWKQGNTQNAEGNR